MHIHIQVLITEHLTRVKEGRKNTENIRTDGQRWTFETKKRSIEENGKEISNYYVKERKGRTQIRKRMLRS